MVCVIVDDEICVGVIKSALWSRCTGTEYFGQHKALVVVVGRVGFGLSCREELQVHVARLSGYGERFKYGLHVYVLLPSASILVGELACGFGTILSNGEQGCDGLAVLNGNFGLLASVHLGERNGQVGELSVVYSFWQN